eukprot:7385130-Pyramimonas_sp.AAC.1
MWIGLLLAGAVVQGAGVGPIRGERINSPLPQAKTKETGARLVGTSSRWSPACPVGAVRTPGDPCAASIVGQASPRRPPLHGLVRTLAGLANKTSLARARKAKAKVAMIDQMEHYLQALFRTWTWTRQRTWRSWQRKQ